MGRASRPEGVEGNARLHVLLALLVVVALVVVAVFLATDDEPPAPPTPPRAASSANSPTPVAPPKAPRRRPVEQKLPVEDWVNDDPDAPRGPVHVRVVAAETREPIAGAEVVVGDFDSAVVLEVEPTRTDARGLATIDGVPARAVTVRARAPGRVVGGADARVGADAPVAQIELVAGASVEVHVVDAAGGAPIGAVVEIQAPSDLHGDTHWTKADGVAKFVGPPRDAYVFHVQATGHTDVVDAVRSGEIGGPPTVLRVELPAGGTVAGVVRDPDGAAAADHLVVLRRAGDEDWTRAARTDAAGAYEFDSLPLGVPYVAEATAAASRFCDSGPSAPVRPRAETPRVVADLRLRRQGSVELQFVDAEGAPLQQIEISLGDESGSFARADGGGGLYRGVGADRFLVRVWRPEFATFCETVDVVEGRHEKRTIRLAPGATVAGLVVDDRGRGVQGAWVRPVRDADDDSPERKCRTDEDGRFELGGLPTGAVALVVDPPFEFDEAGATVASAPAENVRVALERRGRLTFRASLEDVPYDARVSFETTRSGEPWKIDRPLPEDCRVEIPWPSRLRGEVTIGVEGFDRVTRPVVVPPGAVVDLGDLRFARTFEAPVVVLDADGAPARGVHVRVHQPRATERDTDERGACSFRDVAPGRLWLGLGDRQPAGQPACSFVVDVVRDRPITLRVPPSGLLVVLARDAVGAPAADGLVKVIDAAGERLDLTDAATDGDGIFKLRVGPGRYVVELADGRRADAEVRAGETTIVRVR